MLKMNYIYSLLTFILFFLCTNLKLSHAQSIISGDVVDAKSGDPLAAANIQIEGTFQGTITNEDGDFVIPLEKIPVNLIISYIGYKSKRIKIDRHSKTHLRIELEPIILEMEAIIVVAEDPALAIMREVIKRKLIWRKEIETSSAKAYSRLVFENDSGIVSIAESLSDTFWDREKGSREVIKSKRQTSNLSEEQNMAVASFIPNFYDDDIDLIGFSVIGPTHPDALDYYDYKLIKEHKIDDKTIFEIQVIPDSKLQPTFEGRLWVIDDVFAIRNVELKPSKTIHFPVPIQELNLYYKQQFSNYDQKFWLPVDYRVQGNIKIGIIGLQFPTIKYKRFTALSDYQVNIELPDTLFEDEKSLVVDSTSVARDTLFSMNRVQIPLTHAEKAAYETLDSTMTLEKAFKPTGFLAKAIEMSSDENNQDGEGEIGLFSWLSPQLWYNRVDELHIGLTLMPKISDKLDVKVGSGYNTGSGKWSFLTEFLLSFGPNNRFKSTLRYERATKTRYTSDTYSLFLASFPPLFARPDYFDYYWQDGFSIDVSYRWSEIRTTFNLGFRSFRETSLEKTTDYNIVGSGFQQRENPMINEGNMRSLLFRVEYGNPYIPFGIMGQNRVSFSVEQSQPGFLKSDFNFSTYNLNADIRIPTFLKRRLLPNILDIHVSAGYSRGSLPLQRFGIVDGSYEVFSPFAVLKTRRSRPYEGENHLGIFWEHNFRTVPFELINFDFLVENGIGIIIFGGHGRSWISDKTLTGLTFTPAYTDRMHNETGVSINNIFSMLRLDTAYRWETKGVYVGFSLARFF
jgi:hypothetical protein